MDEQPSSEAGARINIGDLWAIVQMQQRVVLGCTALVLLLALIYSLVATRYYRSVAVLHLSTMAGQEIRTDRVVDLDQYHRWNRQIFVQTQLEIIRSRKMRSKILEAYEALGLDDGLKLDEEGLRELANMLDIKVRQGTELIDVAITSPDPEMSARLANLVVNTYRDNNLSVLTESAEDAKDWLQTQLLEKETEIAEASRLLREFQRANDMADAEEDVTSLSATMDSLNEAKGQANTERVLHETTVWTHEALLKAGDYEQLAKNMNTPLIVSLTQDFARATTEQARVAAIYGEKMPQRRTADAELARIESELKAEVERTLAAEKARLRVLRNKEASLSKEIAGGKEQLLVVQERKEEYAKKLLALERARDFYRRLSQRKDELDLQSKTQLNNVRVVQEAWPIYQPVEPRIPINLLLGLLGGAVLGLSIGLLREYLDDTISSPLEVKTFLKVPFLGMIPKIERIDDETDLALYTHVNPRSTIAETIRGTRTVLELSSANGVLRRMLVTSAVSAEGKTSTVVRLGVAFANLDRKVLMIDADLRRPRIHKIFGHEREPGFTTVLSGAVSLDEAIHETAVPNLWYLSSGRGGEHPNELLASPRVPELLDTIGERFDLILIDSPPSVMLSDARILSRYVDGVVVLAREHATSRVLIRDAIVGLEQVGAKVFGVIVNAVDFGKRRTSYKYYYGYGYRYDKYYGYGEASPDDEASQ
ncbi:MAG TPA: polysaccharide biosynthesis tyrosine autokinase [Deltaproteobacteria bacterium]|nr:polysaccharide biosynthesis tyrosine autokinase [Deltaproteobacteria bacterium]